MHPRFSGIFGLIHTVPDRQIGSLQAFLVFGLGTEVLAVVLLLLLFRRLGWMGRK